MLDRIDIHIEVSKVEFNETKKDVKVKVEYTLLTSHWVDVLQPEPGLPSSRFKCKYFSDIINAMFSHLLATKLNTPKKRPSLIPRPKLIAKLNSGLSGRLTLVSAPAGFGKTTLVSHWLEQLGENKGNTDQKTRFSWLSLDEDDNDLVRFLTYFIAALNQGMNIETDIGQGALSMLQSPQPPPVNTVLIPLINNLAAIPEKIIFVLDDYHLITNQEIHQLVEVLILID